MTNLIENHTDIKNDIINRNLTLKITLNDRRKKKWQKFKRNKRVIRTPRKSTKVPEFAEIALELPKHVHVTDNMKHRKRITKESLQERNDGSLTNDNWNNFFGNKEAVIEEQYNADVVLSKAIDHEKDCIKQKIIQFIRRNEVYFSSSNVSTDTTVIVKE